MRKPHSGLGVACVALAALSFSGCHRQSPPPTISAPPVVEIVHAVSVDAGNSLTVTGALRHEHEITLSFRTGGTMTSLYVDEGDAIEKGQLLATVDPTAQRTQLAQSAADLSKAHRDLQRFRSLISEGAISRQQLEDQQTTLELAQEAFRSARFDVDGTRIVSPVKGFVLTRDAQAGQVVLPGQAVLEVTDDSSPLLLRVALPDEDAMRLKSGMPTVVQLDAPSGGKVAGRIWRIGKHADLQSGAVDIDIVIPALFGWRSGMIASASIAIPRQDDANHSVLQRVPAEALVDISRQVAVVYLFDERHKIVHRQRVRFHGFDGDDALISNLPISAAIVTAGAGFLHSGQSVEVAHSAPSTQR